MRHGRGIAGRRRGGKAFSPTEKKKRKEVGYVGTAEKNRSPEEKSNNPKRRGIHRPPPPPEKTPHGLKREWDMRFSGKKVVKMCKCCREELKEKKKAPVHGKGVQFRYHHTKKGCFQWGGGKTKATNQVVEKPIVLSTKKGGRAGFLGRTAEIFMRDGPEGGKAPASV